MDNAQGSKLTTPVVSLDQKLWDDLKQQITQEQDKSKETKPLPSKEGKSETTSQ